LHSARTGARDRERKGVADILRTDAYPASLTAALTAKAKKNGWTVVTVSLETQKLIIQLPALKIENS
jgi:hypothetical protein